MHIMTRGRANFIESRMMTTNAAEIITIAIVDISLAESSKLFSGSRRVVCLVSSTFPEVGIVVTPVDDKEAFAHSCSPSIGHNLFVVDGVGVVVVEAVRAEDGVDGPAFGQAFFNRVMSIEGSLFLGIFFSFIVPQHSNGPSVKSDFALFLLNSSPVTGKALLSVKYPSSTLH